MDNIVIIAILFAVLVAFIASLWYLLQTIRIIWAYSSLLAILAVPFSPIVHIIFYFIPKDAFGDYEKMVFKRYFLSLLAIAALGVCAAIVIPDIKTNQDDVIVSEIDASQPWEWDIRAENQDEMLALTDYEDSNNKTAELHFEAIYQAHPDADNIVESPEFEAWKKEMSVKEQDDITRILREGTSSEVIYIFTLFKKDLQDYRDYEYQIKQDNAQALAQRGYQEKQNRDLETVRSNNQRNISQQQPYDQTAAQSSVQQTHDKQSFSYKEKQEREKLKATLSTPMKGANGELTKSQRESLAALETGQPMPLKSPSTGGSTPPTTPSNMTNCDGAGCWDTNGTRYNKGAGNTYFPSTGGVCQNIGGRMQCN